MSNTDTDLFDEGDQLGTATSDGWHERIVRLGVHAILLFFSVVAIIPFAWAFLTSLKPEEEIFTTIFQLVPANPTIQNYAFVFTETLFDRWMMNSLIVTVGVIFFTLLVDSLAGYALAKGDFRGQKTVYMLVIGMLIIPPQVILVPLFLELRMLGWVDTYWAIMVLYIANPFGTFMMRQFFVSLPDHLIDAARLDGCSKWDIYLRIMLPMAKPALASLAVFTFVFTWGGFIWPLVITNSTSMFPVQVGIGLLKGPYSKQWGPLLAAALTTAVPVLVAYLLAQKTFMSGIALKSW
jgi:multiple sugar transport system permease protein